MSVTWTFVVNTYDDHVIVLDSSLLMDFDHPHDTRLTILRLVAEQSGHPLALPETALHEYVSFCRANLAGKILAATTAISELLTALDTWPGRSQWESLPEPNLAELTEEVEHNLRRSFEILPMTEEILREAVISDIYRGEVCDAAERTNFIRDSAMWLTVKSTCAASGATPVLFIASDNEFGKWVLRSHAISDKPDNLVYCAGIEHAVAELTGPAEADRLLKSGLAHDSTSTAQWSSRYDDVGAGQTAIDSPSLHLGDYETETRPRPRIAHESWMNNST